MQNKSISPLRIGLTYIGVVVGAGFASGQEIYRFFNVFGVDGLCGIIISTIIFWLLGYQILKLGKRINAKSYLDIVEHFSGKNSSKIIDIILVFFLFGTYAAMLSGSGAIAQQYFGFPSVIGGIVMAVITAFTVILGLERVITSISFVVPFLIASVIFICIQSNLNTEIISGFNYSYIGISGNWLTSALLYAFYNLTFSIAVLAPLGAQVKDTKSLYIGSLIGAIGLGVGSIVIFITLNSDFSSLSSIDIPMLYFAKKISDVSAMIFLIVLIAEIYTTAVGNLYGIVARFSSRSNFKSSLVAIVLAILGCIGSLLGFSNLVAYLYPIMGYVGAVLFLLALLKSFSKKRQQF